ncbi:MAG: MgtC/SapB family protein [Leptospirillia bacterium]
MGAGQGVKELLDDQTTAMLIRIGLAILAGGMIGLERTYHGRPAGFRTHTLVCVSSALLMQFTAFQWDLLSHIPDAMETVRIDPTRMAQGIMTGIGFLGAGVIVKEGITVRGLTTAASIWITASIGIVVGMGMYFAGFVATIVATGVLSLFRWLEKATPTLRYARLTVCFKRPEHMEEDTLRELVRSHHIEWTTPSFRLEGEGRIYTYEMTVRTRHARNFQKLAEHLNGIDEVLEFCIQPTGD